MVLFYPLWVLRINLIKRKRKVHGFVGKNETNGGQNVLKRRRLKKKGSNSVTVKNSKGV